MVGNYIRACFCIKNFLDFQDLHELTETLVQYGCYPVGAPTTNMGKWIYQTIEWKIQNASWESRLFQLSLVGYNWAVVSFDIDEDSFLPGTICYKPDHDPIFAVYKQIIMAVVRYLDPEIGIIDYEAELLCSELHTTPLADWGNYFPKRFLKLLSSKERKLLPQVVDEFLQIDNLGVLTFIHPLMANQAWSDRHAKLDKLISPHLIKSFPK